MSLSMCVCVCVMCLVIVGVVHWSARPGTEGHFRSLWDVFEVRWTQQIVGLFSIFLTVGGQPLAI